MDFYDEQRDHYLRKLLAVERRRADGERKERFSVARLVRGMATTTVAGGPITGSDGRTEHRPYFAGNALDGYEREAMQEVARRRGVPYDPARVCIPWAFFAGANTIEEMTRAWQVATSSSGGYLVSPATTLAAADALRPWSIAVSAGITVEAGLVGNISIPLTTGTSTGEWLASETTQIGTSSPTLGNVTLAPKNGGAHVQFSRQLALQSSAETFIQRELLRTVGGMLDRAILSGTGTSEPLGILNTANVPAASGASLNVAAIAALEGDVGNANVMDENISLVTHPDVRELLRKRVATGSGRFCWERDVCGLPGYTTTGLGTNVAIVGGWAEAILGLWGPGPEFMLNPYQNFQAAIVGARVMVAADVGVRFPAAFSVSTGIT